MISLVVKAELTQKIQCGDEQALTDVPRAEVDDLDLHVEELDAVDGTPVLDIKPWFREFGPRGTVRQAAWSSEMLTAYFATQPHDS